MSWFKKPKQKLVSQKRELPGEMWDRCGGCGEILYSGRLEESLHVCPNCGHHFRITAESYEALLLDGGGLEVAYDQTLRSADPLGFVDSRSYAERVSQAEKRGGDQDAIRTGRGEIDGREVHLGTMDFRFIGGSMGSVVGEKIRRLADRSLERRVPLIIISASGGARMQEGILSLMQMGKTATALEQLAGVGIPYLSVLTNPTTGGVTASHAMLGDVILAEPGALIGFAGPRVIKETIRQDLPEGFQTAEFLEEHGMIDRIVPRPELRGAISSLLAHMC
ncbi:acetyl-CoA carboxylase, carboxyltransferase subunit beta [Candidatus Palauibacter sp.]|uniref:acetyl-CoA carboxylase, carboxyltransferase subunit beta n=1 Tax=Candidatus Palauibacter sp. TaxID=3101350 RepID=UPI003AF2A9BC